MAAEINGSSPGTLQSICYERGSLRLLDQTRLPLETVYLDIKDSSDGWTAIRDMVVRGAPAIAIAAALSLAIEVFNLDFSGTPEDAASYLAKKLEYLVSSRPTAVNLSDAAEKLRSLVLKIAETANEAQTVFQAYVDAAETMLVDDVAANKAIGFHGASHLGSHLENMQKISVLTHCNTGSLATAGYGTALGVIRALQTEGWLTAFELVHDQIPATLIADSAVAALMKAGVVNAVVVGADRIAANGDTANKIGTYSVALSAYHHGIQFYVAAPITSIDLSISSGDQIVIEERSEKELLHSDGGRGKQVAASGISVWNPAFDVTPARLITAIFTEKGVIRKSSEDAFDIKGFIESANGIATDLGIRGNIFERLCSLSSIGGRDSLSSCELFCGFGSYDDSYGKEESNQNVSSSISLITEDTITTTTGISTSGSSSSFLTWTMKLASWNIRDFHKALKHFDKAMVNSHYPIDDYESYVDFAPLGFLSDHCCSKPKYSFGWCQLPQERMSQAQAAGLIALVTTKEIKEALFDIGANKAPDPDDFNAKFYMAAWDKIEDDFITTEGSFPFCYLGILLAMEKLHIANYGALLETITKKNSMGYTKSKGVTLGTLGSPPLPPTCGFLALRRAANMKLIEWFATKQNRSALAYEFFHPRMPNVPCFSMIWKSCILPKHHFIAWLLTHGKLRTTDNLPYEPKKMCVLCRQLKNPMPTFFFACAIAESLFDRIKR
ncbi:hypothetical protein ZIOFF_033423 [Zingiber officinale]|uniref:Methylthioribose-1-phosphate isomerase n=1 Tax=Zingiber officinale TaxID=94328 RepID=A0A8J5GK98_ZINOF|nr:hypothetical protein ZIOFF_033423 [Zingiber officinale]